jgi:hypothetical protein
VRVCMCVVDCVWEEQGGTVGSKGRARKQSKGHADAIWNADGKAQGVSSSPFFERKRGDLLIAVAGR